MNSRLLRKGISGPRDCITTPIRNASLGSEKEPFKFEEFQEKYRYQLQDEGQARDQAVEEQSKQLEKVTPDPTDPKALMEFMEKAQSVQAGQTTMMLLDSYQPQFFGAPTVYILEERQIG